LAALEIEKKRGGATLLGKNEEGENKANQEPSCDNSGTWVLFFDWKKGNSSSHISRGGSCRRGVRVETGNDNMGGNKGGCRRKRYKEMTQMSWQTKGVTGEMSKQRRLTRGLSGGKDTVFSRRGWWSGKENGKLLKTTFGNVTPLI